MSERDVRKIGLILLYLSFIGATCLPALAAPVSKAHNPFNEESTIPTAASVQILSPRPIAAVSNSDTLSLSTPGLAKRAVASLVLLDNTLLSQDINLWAQNAGYKMLWNSDKDFMIYNTITLTGNSTDEVLGELAKIFTSENYGLVIKLYEKNHVLLIDEQ